MGGCTPSFDVDRHTLGPFRIAALGQVEGQASGVIWSGSLFHTAPTSLVWTADGAALGEGWDVAVPADATRLGLVATAPDGTERTATVSVGNAPALPDISRFAVTLGDDLSLDARRDAVETPVDGSVESGEAVRLRAVDQEPDLDTRWMLAEGDGTLLEVDASSVDVLSEDVLFDDGEVESREALPAGTRHVLALTLDGGGGNRWAWTDAAFGVDGPLVAHGGWLLPLDVSTGTGLVAVTMNDVTADGVGQWSDPQPALDLSSQDELACALVGEPFELSWLVDGRCTTPEVEGARVVLEVE
jgi:hypothetical protein